MTARLGEHYATGPAVAPVFVERELTLREADRRIRVPGTKHNRDTLALSSAEKDGSDTIFAETGQHRGFELHIPLNDQPIEQIQRDRPTLLTGFV